MNTKCYPRPRAHQWQSWNGNQVRLAPDWDSFLHLPWTPSGLTLDRYPLLPTSTEETLRVHEAHLTHCSYTPPGSR